VKLVAALIVAATVVALAIVGVRAWQRRLIESQSREVEIRCALNEVELENHGAAKTVTLIDVWQNDHSTVQPRKNERLGRTRQVELAANTTAKVALYLSSPGRCEAPRCWTMVSYSWPDERGRTIWGSRQCAPAAPATRSPPPPASPTP
jgi:hypothetical protein